MCAWEAGLAPHYSRLHLLQLLCRVGSQVHKETYLVTRSPGLGKPVKARHCTKSSTVFILTKLLHLKGMGLGCNFLCACAL